MSLVGLVVAPPAMIVLRKLMRRVRAIVKAQFTGGTRIVETLQETLQGLRVVKAFTLEDEMRRRFDTSVADVQHEADKWARVANRASPLMETLGGLAIGVVDRLQRLPGHLQRRRRPAASSRSSPRSCSPTSRPSASRGSTSSSTTTWSACACCSR